MARSASRFVRFAGGLISGLLVLPILGVLGLAGMYVTETVGGRFAPPPPSRPWVEVRGQDVSAAGGVRIVLKDGWHLLRLDCRDACDDLVETGGPPRRLEVLNAAGVCVACQEQKDGLGRRLKTWLVRGRPLKIVEGGA